MTLFFAWHLSIDNAYSSAIKKCYACWLIRLLFNDAASVADFVWHRKWWEDGHEFKYNDWDSRGLFRLPGETEENYEQWVQFE
jgi:hypothetical protein